MSLRHEVVKIIGGRYYDKKSDTLYLCRGSICLFLISKKYNIKKWFVLKSLKIQESLLLYRYLSVKFPKSKYRFIPLFIKNIFAS